MSNDYIDSKEFEERADFIEETDLLNWTVDNAYFQKIQRKIIDRGAKLIVGPRGTGKTHQFRHAFHSCANDNHKPLAIYVSFGKYYHLEPLLFKSANAITIFHTWVLSKILFELIKISETLKIDLNIYLKKFDIESNDLEDFIYSAERNISIEKFENIIQNVSINRTIHIIDVLLKHSKRKRTILLLDDAALTLTPDYMVEFFDIFRSLKTTNISPKASVYPGTTHYGPRFHINQDAEEVSAWLNVEDENYSIFMEEILNKRFSTQKINKDIIEILKFASFGIPRAFITLLRSYQQTEGITQQQKFNKVIDNQKNLLEKEYLSLSLKLPQYNSIIKIGLDFYNKIIHEIYIANEDNPTQKKTHFGILQNELSNKSNRMIKFLIEAGLLYQINSLSDGNQRDFNRYIPHYLFLLNNRVFSSSKGFNTKGIIEAINKKNDKRPVRKQLSTILPLNQIDNLKLDLPVCNNCGTDRLSEEQRFCHNCGSPLVGQSAFEAALKISIDELPIPEWQIKRIKDNTKIETIEDIYSSQNLASDLRKAKYIGVKRSSKINDIVKEIIEEFLA